MFSQPRSTALCRWPERRRQQPPASDSKKTSCGRRTSGSGTRYGSSSGGQWRSRRGTGRSRCHYRIKASEHHPGQQQRKKRRTRGTVNRMKDLWSKRARRQSQARRSSLGRVRVRIDIVHCRHACLQSFNQHSKFFLLAVIQPILFKFLVPFHH